jgi:GT2 family glycosyltransferase
LLAEAPRPLAAWIQVSIREHAGSEHAIWSRIIARVGRHLVPASVSVDVPLASGAGEVDLVLRATPLIPGTCRYGTVLWRDAVVEVTASLAPPLPELRRDPRPPSRPKPSNGAPLISLLTPVHDPAPEMLSAALDSVRRQAFPAWELCLVDDASRDPRVLDILDAVKEDPRIRLVRREQSGGIATATNDALAMATGEYVACLDHDDELEDDALATVAAALEESPDADLLYSDEDLVFDDERYALVLKPDWSPDLLRSTMYMGHLIVCRRALTLELDGFRSAFDGSQDYDFVLRASERARRIVHIPRVLYHWRVHGRSASGSDTAKPYAFSAALRALSEHLRRTGVDGEMHYGVIRGVYRVVHPPPTGTRTAVILPVIGEAGRAAEEVAVVTSSWAACEFRPHELVLVGRPDVVSACADGLPAGDSTRLVPVPAPHTTDLARLMNAGAAAVDSECLVLLDGPVEGLTRDWLMRLIGFATQAGVGAAGAKTLAADGRVENSGIVISDGLPLPVLHGADPGHPGPHGMARVPCNLSAVSGVVAIQRETFFELGGIDEHMGALGVIDFCLRARERGMRIVSAPDAVVRRTGSAGPSNALGALYAFRMRWRDRLGSDPYFNPGYYGDHVDFASRPDV